MDIIETGNIYQKCFIRLISLGFDATRAHSIAAAQVTLKRGCAELIQYKQRPHEECSTLNIGITAAHDEILIHDDIMLPEWREFTDELSSIPTSEKEHINLTFKQVQIDQKVAKLLLHAFKTAPLKILALRENGLGSEGIEFAVNALEMSTTLACLSIYDNVIEAKNDAISLVRAVRNHPKLVALYLNNCGLGRNESVLEALVPLLDTGLGWVCLESNEIGSHGASLISNCLASNPDKMVRLHLDDNLLNDDDAKMFAASMGTNDKLQALQLSGNHITQVGRDALHLAVNNLSSLNALHDSNHTCSFQVGEEDNCQLSVINLCRDPELNRKIKILKALKDIKYLEDVPIGIMPRVLAFLQGIGEVDGTKYNGVDQLFQVMCGWNMPLLYTLTCLDH